MIFENIEDGDTIEELSHFVEANIDMDSIYRMLEDEWNSLLKTMRKIREMEIREQEW